MMNATTTRARRQPSLPSPAAVLAVSLLGAALVGSALIGAQLPLVTSDRRAVAGLAILGWILCSMAGGPTIVTVGWRHPAVAAAIALGLCNVALILLVALDRADALAAAAGGLGIQASGNRIALVCLAAIMAVKILIGLTVRAAAARASTTRPAPAAQRVEHPAGRA